MTESASESETRKVATDEDLLASLKQELESDSTPEEKARLVLRAMRDAISQEGKPQLHRFWAARKFAVPILQQEVHPALRSQLWAEYRELTAEAKRLKELLDKESAYAEEQIELAIAAVEQEVDNKEALIAEKRIFALLHPCPILEAHLATYSTWKKELDLLTFWAERINSLRKDLTQQEMRVSRKTKLFRRLSELGDRVFPCRKELRKNISEQFLRDVQQFKKERFEDKPDVAPFVLRDEVKAFQAAAKDLYLVSAAFSESRKTLSTCWETLREQEVEWKKERAQQRLAFREIVDHLKQRIATIAEQLESSELSAEAASKELEQVSREEREAALGQRERKAVRSLIAEVRKSLFDKEKAKRQAVAKEKARKSEASQAERKNFEAQIASLSFEKIAQIELAIEEAELVSADRKELLSQMQQKKEVLQLHQWEQTVHTFGEKQSLEEEEMGELHAVLDQLEEQRQTVYDSVEKLRRFVGGSGLDFSAALTSRQQLDDAKQLLTRYDEMLAAGQQIVERQE